MIRLVAAASLALVTVTVGCVNERTYIDPDTAANEMSGWQSFDGTGRASLRGTVGELNGIDNTADNMWVSKDTTSLSMSGDVPHQAQTGSSVFLDILIINREQLAIGEELRQEGTVDVWAEDTTEQGPMLDVYICPNGEGVSGNADDIVVTRTGPDTYIFEARSTDTTQNLDVDLDLAADAE